MATTTTQPADPEAGNPANDLLDALRAYTTGITVWGGASPDTERQLLAAIDAYVIAITSEPSDGGF